MPCKCMHPRSGKYAEVPATAATLSDAFMPLTATLIHHPLSLSFQTQNLLFLQILPTAAFLFLLQH